MRTKVPQQDPNTRIKNFSEVALGYSEEQAHAEASRCLQCKNAPCSKGCPVEIDIPAFIKLIREKKRKESLLKVKEKNNLPAICGRVCPQEDQCEAACVLNKKNAPINIGTLERYAADYELARFSSEDARPHPENYTPKTNDRIKVAVVGSGPAGLTCAADLAKMDFGVWLFESLHIPGGVLVYGIPEFRLPKNIVRSEVEYVKNLGVTVVVDTLIGYSYTLEDLFQENFAAILIATGAGLPQFLGIPGENLGRVYSANEFLTRLNLMKAYLFPEYATPINIGDTVAVIGGGNVALDAARSCLRLGKKVFLVYRRSSKEMPARIEEVENAKEEGVMFQLLTQPTKIISDENGMAKSLECITMELGEPDGTGRRRPMPRADSNFILKVDTVIVAIGQNPNPLLSKTATGLNINPDGTLKVDKNFMTSLRGVFAGGDIVSGADTVISAMRAGKKAAMAIANYIRNSKKKEII